jgi:hypothetical protein
VSPSTRAPAATALREVVATRYVLALREGGSLPGVVEGDDLGTYVCKFHGAGQGRKALVAEVVAAGLARTLGLRVPELVLLTVDPAMSRAEPDEEVQDLLRASAGLNLGVDFLPGSLGFDPSADPVDAGTAAAVVWFDALVHNVDRSWRNPNLLRWHGRMWLIDHGASLWFHHDWSRREAAATRPYGQVSDHVLLRCASSVADADTTLAPLLDDPALRAATAAVPDAWLADEPGFASPEAVRDAYVEVLAARLAQRETWVPPLEDARARV